VPVVALALIAALFLEEIPLGARRPVGEPAQAEALSAGL
jgi:hypothetical protein